MLKSDELVDKSGRLSPKIYPIFLCRPHWIKVGCVSEAYLGTLATMLKGEMCRGEFFPY